MEVYVLLGNYHYEPVTLFGVYSTEEKAKEAKENLETKVLYNSLQIIKEIIQ